MIHVWNNLYEAPVLTDKVPHTSRELPFKRGTNKAMDSHQELMPTPRKKGKRFRSAFTTQQVNYLENEFKKYPYIGHVQRKEVATILNIPEKAVKVWFQNRRMREKNLYKEIDFDNRNGHGSRFSNEQLINVCDVPPVSDTSLNLTPLTACKDATNNDVAVYEEPKKIQESSKNYFGSEIAQNFNKSPVDKGDNKATSSVSKTQNSPSFEASAEFSIDLCKKYRSNLIRRYGQEKGSTSETQTSQVSQPLEQDITVKEEPKRNLENEPEDLSHKSGCRFRFEGPSKSTSRNNLEFQPVYVANYTQPYLPPPNVLWNPVNIMPLLPTPSAISSSSIHSETLTTAQEQTRPKKPCNCDCHVDTPSPQSSEGTNRNQHPQYIITAVPFPNYPKF